MKKLKYLFLTSLLFVGCEKENENEPSISSSSDPVVEFSSTQLGQDLNSRYTWTFNLTAENTSLFIWDFGDGSTSSDQNPTHTYTKAGDYTVTLTAYGIPASGRLLGPDVQISQDVSIEGPKAADYLVGSWSPRNFKVGPYSGAGDWFDYGYSGARPCLEDDTYTFNSDGSLTINHGTETWLESWQTGDGDYCGTPKSPYTNGSYSWSIDSADRLTLTGNGAYLVLSKAHNNGEDGIASSRTYNITDITPTSMTVSIDVSGGSGSVWWTYNLIKN